MLKAAIYLNDAAMQKATLAGFYNIHWSQIETAIEIIRGATPLDCIAHAITKGP